MASNYEIKEKIVLAGESKVFNSWHENAGVTMEDFLDGLRWLCDDPMPGGKLSRELGCVRFADSGYTQEQKEMWGPFTPHRPGVDGLHRLTRSYYSDGSFAGFFDENGMRWGGTTDYASISARDRV